MCTEPVLICGDFNIHVDNQANPNTVALFDLLDSMGLEQHVGVPTQIHGHTLDLIITRKTDTIIFDSPTSDNFLSDHAIVLCNHCMNKSKLTVKNISYRKLESMDLDAFKADLCVSDLLLQSPLQLNNLVESYNTTLVSLLDKYAPTPTRSIVTRHRVPWFTDEIRSAKRRLRRCAERKWRQSRTQTLCCLARMKALATRLKWRSSGLKAFKSMKNRTTRLMNSVRCEFYTNFINKNSDDQRKLFCATKKLLNKCAETPFPPHSDKLALANDMGAYFAKKISDIRVELDSAVGSPDVMPTTPIAGPPVCAVHIALSI